MHLVPITLQENRMDEMYSSKECQELFRMYESFYPSYEYELPRIGYFIIDKNTIIGSCGFVGKPKDNTVEIAYWTFQEFEVNGIATFACKILLKIAYEHLPEIHIVAKTAPEGNVSTRILEKNNFIQSDIVIDDELGEAWLWKHQKT